MFGMSRISARRTDAREPLTQVRADFGAPPRPVAVPAADADDDGAAAAVAALDAQALLDDPLGGNLGVFDNIPDLDGGA